MRPFGVDADLLILIAGSWRSKIFAVSLRMYALGTVKVSPKRPLKRSARSRVSSMCWRWSSPTGTSCAWYSRMSATWRIGYVNRPTVVRSAPCLADLSLNWVMRWASP